MRFPFRGRPLIGVVHLAPLPGSPHARASIDAIAGAALRDAASWIRGGADGLILENFGDLPFAPGLVDPHVPTIMAVIAREFVRCFAVPIGINVLRNDARSALAAAAASGASFIRVNVHTGAMETDQGVIQGRAHDTLRYRTSLGIDVAIFADVFVKHAAPLLRTRPGRAALDAVQRGMADALLVTGSATGDAADPERFQEVRRAVPRTPVLVASGVTPDTAGDFPGANGFIVGTYAKRGGLVSNPVDVARVKKLAASLRSTGSRPRRSSRAGATGTSRRGPG